MVFPKLTAPLMDLSTLDDDDVYGCPTRGSDMPASVRQRLDAGALEALAQLEASQAEAIATRLEQAGSSVRNPSAYVHRAVNNAKKRASEGGPAAAMGGCLASSASSNNSLFAAAQRRPQQSLRGKLDANAVAALDELPADAARAILDELASKAIGKVRNPSAYVVKAVGNARRGVLANNGGVPTTSSAFASSSSNVGPSAARSPGGSAASSLTTSPPLNATSPPLPSSSPSFFLGLGVGAASSVTQQQRHRFVFSSSSGSGSGSGGNNNNSNTTTSGASGIHSSIHGSSSSGVHRGVSTSPRHDDFFPASASSSEATTPTNARRSSLTTSPFAAAGGHTTTTLNGALNGGGTNNNNNNNNNHNPSNTNQALRQQNASPPTTVDAAAAARVWSDGAARNLDSKAAAALLALPAHRAVQILTELRRKRATIRNPSAYVMRATTNAMTMPPGNQTPTSPPPAPASPPLSSSSPPLRRPDFDFRSLPEGVIETRHGFISRAPGPSNASRNDNSKSVFKTDFLREPTDDPVLVGPSATLRGVNGPTFFDDWPAPPPVSFHENF